MRKIAVFTVTLLLLLLVAVPWILSGCKPRSLVPENLILSATANEVIKMTAQKSTEEASRNSTSVVQVVPIGTAVGFEAVVSTATNTSASTNTPTQGSSTVIIITSVSGGDEATPVVTTPISGMVTSSPTSVGGLPPTPMGMTDIEDVITSDILTERLRVDAAGSNLTNLIVSLTPDGILVNGSLELMPGIDQPIAGQGVFEVENYSLVVKISSIVLGGADVTQQYYQQLESRIETSLYYLLPLRYVQSFQLINGELHVLSKVKP